MGPRSLQSSRRAFYAPFCQSGSDPLEPRYNAPRGTGPGNWKAPVAPSMPYLLRLDLTNRSRDITIYLEQRKKKFSVTIFFAEIIAHRGTGPESLESSRCGYYALFSSSGSA
uniref:Uncharacterized protein n=1 Tax=Vespula pensylvanica TaxID=30213 RepID=A0A834J4J7_VESPE|nr:hypothetical protein H0235_018485 [Vespula pensylvanica]